MIGADTVGGLAGVGSARCVETDAAVGAASAGMVVVGALGDVVIGSDSSLHPRTKKSNSKDSVN